MQLNKLRIYSAGCTYPFSMMQPGRRGLEEEEERPLFCAVGVLCFGCLLFPPTTAAAAAAFEFVSLFLLLETNRELNARVNSTRPPSFTSVRPYVCVCVVVVSFNLVKLACVTQVKAVWSVSRITRNSSESRRVRGTTATTRKKEGKKRNQQTIHTRHWTYVSYQVKEEEEENSFSF